MTMFYDRDANFEIYKNRKLAVIGFGSQGHAHALNLKENGLAVTPIVEVGKNLRAMMSWIK